MKHDDTEILLPEEKEDQKRSLVDFLKTSAKLIAVVFAVFCQILLIVGMFFMLAVVCRISWNWMLEFLK